MSETGETLRRTAEDRKSVLDATLQRYGAQGWRIETRSDFQATIARGKEVSHVLHLLLTVFTLGLWILIWALIGLVGGTKRRMITVDEYGNVVEQKL